MKSNLIARVTALGLVAVASLAGLATGCSTDVEGEDERIDDLWAAKNTRWPASSDGRTRISVCWETPGFPEEKGIVKSALVQTWSAVSKVEFTGWGPCVGSSTDIRIRIADEQPRVARATGGKVLFGKDLKGVPGGLTLNFRWNVWGQACSSPESKRRTCIWSAAVHEFGHVLGFLHEQDRLDAPSTCPDGQILRSDTDPSIGTALGPYDPSSIMNYCNPNLFTSPALSAKDVEGAQRLYGVGASSSGGLDGGAGGAGGTDAGRNCPGGCFGIPEGGCYRSPTLSGGRRYYICTNGCLEPTGFCM